MCRLRVVRLAKIYSQTIVNNTSYIEVADQTFVYYNGRESPSASLLPFSDRPSLDHIAQVSYRNLNWEIDNGQRNS